MAQLELSKINEILSDVNRLSNKYTVMKRLEQDAGQSVETVYDAGIKPLFVRVTVKCDSYGDNEYVHSVEFVKAVEKTVNTYEPIETK